MKHYEVAAAVIVNGDKLLITSRPEGDKWAGFWEFPGGKQEPQETLEDCLLREIREELGLEIAITKYLMSVDYQYPDFSVSLHVFECRYLGGEIKPLPGVKWQWVNRNELKQFQFLPADEKIIKRLIKGDES